jgi:lysophospholipase L1-like esterase
MSRKLIPLLATACVLACLLPSTALASTVPRYYLALGDSLAVGWQPNPAGAGMPTNQGYVDDLYAAARHRIDGLKLKKLGCPGESTTTMLHGGICHYGAGNQLSQAVKFIRKHRIAFITLDIGANDVDSCATSSGIDLTCVGNGIKAIQTNVPMIVGKLRKAAGKRTKVAAMTYYDPFLADYLTGTSGQNEAFASVALATQINGDLASDFRAKHFKVADVATAFDTYTPFADTTTYSGQTVPVAVARICQWTWMCAPAPRGPDIHANAAGYREIATVFKHTLF